MRRERAPMAIPTDHRVLRPFWTCGADDEPWPCAPARELLIGAYGSGSTSLSVHMAQLMAIAAIDLCLPSATALYRRFVAWTLPQGHRCHECGRPSHAVVAGLPPRLSPCDGMATARAATTTP